MAYALLICRRINSTGFLCSVARAYKPTFSSNIRGNESSEIDSVDFAPRTWVCRQQWCRSQHHCGRNMHLSQRSIAFSGVWIGLIILQCSFIFVCVMEWKIKHVSKGLAISIPYHRAQKIVWTIWSIMLAMYLLMWKTPEVPVLKRLPVSVFQQSLMSKLC